MNVQSGGEHKGSILPYFNKEPRSYAAVVQNNGFDLDQDLCQILFSQPCWQREFVWSVSLCFLSCQVPAVAPAGEVAGAETLQRREKYFLQADLSRVDIIYILSLVRSSANNIWPPPRPHVFWCGRLCWDQRGSFQQRSCHVDKQAASALLLHHHGWDLNKTCKSLKRTSERSFALTETGKYIGQCFIKVSGSN